MATARRAVYELKSCLHQLVQSALQKRHGINEIIRLIGRAVIGTYKPRHTDEEHLMSVVLYQLGGCVSC